jgi:AraC-like DNA-binding protein
MLTQEHLALRRWRLKPPEQWCLHEAGLVFVFPQGGIGHHVVGSVEQRLEPGDVLVLNAPSGSELAVADLGELSFASFSASLEHLFPLFAGKEIGWLQNVTEVFKGSKFYPGASALARECHRLLGEVPSQFNLEHRGQLLRVAAAILTEEFKTAQTLRAGYVRAEEHMLQVFERLTTAELMSLSVGELADRFGCSRRHLNRLFRQYFDISVAALRMEMRLLKAVSLLRGPDARIINVAEECGFNHLGLFNVCFKRRFGISPGQWRRSGAPHEI